jgi:hypothetical protein
MHIRPIVTSFMLAFLSAGALAACGGSSSAKPVTPSSEAASPADRSCPAAVPGTSVSAEDTDTGGALVFVTTGDVAEVRKRVAAMAAMHNEHHSKMGSTPAPGGGEGMDHDMKGMDHSKMGGMDHDMEGMDHSKMGGMEGMMMGVHSTATAEDVEGGARLVLSTDPGDVGKLQNELRMHAQHMADGTCPMMGNR